MRKSKKDGTGLRARILTCAVSLVLLILPLLIMLLSAFALRPVYKDTFVGELSDKYELLKSTEGEKIVVIGGSSVAFGINSEMMEEHLGMSTVNFGLYANLGTKIMLDLSRSSIGEGDIIILAPELSSQTLSLYFNAETALQAIDGSFGMLSEIDTADYLSFVGALWGFASGKLYYTASGKTPENSGAYRKEWFNENGDNTYDRPYNVMSTVQKSITLDYRVDKTDGVKTEYEKFIDYVNEYTAYCESRGASVYFSFAPMNAAALSDYNTEENIYAFYDNLSKSLRCRVISNVNDYIMDEGYFFDSEFHLNNSGVTVRTVRLIDDIKRELGIDKITMSADMLPEPSGYAPVDFTEGDSENLYFTLKTVPFASKTAVYITGLNEEGMKQTVLTVPNNINGVPVIGIEEGALSGSEVRIVYLGENIRSLASGALSGAENLRAVYVPRSKTMQTDAERISVPNSADANGLCTKGAPAGLKIYVPASALEVYKQDYFWGDYKNFLEGYE